MPVLYVPHGGGPWPFVDVGFGSAAETSALSAFIRSIAAVSRQAPRAVLVVSAHWEAPVATVTSSPAPPLEFDYYGFPPAAYELTWPAPGSPPLAARVRELLGAREFASAEDDERGFDHGAFVPLKLAFPEADVPTVQLSLVRGLDAPLHIALGAALAPLRDEGVLIVGSGMTFHNMNTLSSPRSRPVAEAFDAWLRDATTAAPADRNYQLERWTEAPFARLAHPREEHLLPLMVAAGAAGDDRARTAFEGTLMGLRISGYAFGDVAPPPPPEL